MDLLRIRTTSDYSIGHNHTIASHGYHNTNAANANYKTEPQSVDSPPSEMYNTSPSSTSTTSSTSSSSCSSSANSSSSNTNTTTVTVKQEPNNNPPTPQHHHGGGAAPQQQHFLIKTELPDPHFNDSQNTTNFKVSRFRRACST